LAKKIIDEFSSILSRHKRWKKRHPERYREYMGKVTKRIRKKVNDYFGDTCWNCGDVKILQKHETKYLKHPVNYPSYYRSRSPRFIALCKYCHASFHKLAEFGYSFEEILLVFRWEIIKEEEQ